MKIEKLILHPNYDPDTGANDIALVRVDRKIALNTTFIRAVCLPFLSEYGIEGKLDIKSSSEMEGKAAWVAGWSRHFWGNMKICLVGIQFQIYYDFNMQY